MLERDSAAWIGQMQPEVILTRYVAGAVRGVRGGTQLLSFE